MALTSSTIKKNATSLTVVAGTDLLFTEDGTDVKNGLHLAASSVVDFRVRPNMTFKTKNPILLPTGDYTKAKRDITYVVPQVLANGKISFDLVRISIEAHPTLAVSALMDMCYVGGQLLTASNFTPFIQSGSLG